MSIHSSLNNAIVPKHHTRLSCQLIIILLESPTRSTHPLRQSLMTSLLMQLIDKTPITSPFSSFIICFSGCLFALVELCETLLAVGVEFCGGGLHGC